MNHTRTGWMLFFAGYAALIIADYLQQGMNDRIFQLLIYTLMIPALSMLYKGTRGKGSFGLRIMIVITQFWIGYALAALLWLLYSNISGLY